jgi:methyltransferase OMS1
LPPPKLRRTGFWVAGGLFLGGVAAYTAFLYATLVLELDYPLPEQDADVSSRYDVRAKNFDNDVTIFEEIFGVNALRKRLTEQASGHVLEVSSGTGRNSSYYDLEKVKSLTFVDQSGPMVEIARKRWDMLHPGYKNCSFYIQSATDPLPATAVPKEGFTTILQTMGICSTPNPAATLAHLGTLVDPAEGRLLLLEHGRSNYSFVNWVLDKSAARHADKHGCWPNRDVGKVLEESGLVIEKIEVSSFGTLYYVEARPGSKQMEATKSAEAKEKSKSFR